MSTKSSAVSAQRSAVPRFAIFPSIAHPETPAPQFRDGSVHLTVRRVRVVPDQNQTRKSARAWPTFEGFALFARASGVLTRLFVFHPTTGCILEWQLERVSRMTEDQGGTAPTTFITAMGGRHDER